MKKASIITGYSCNNNCKFCYDKTKKREFQDLKTNEIKLKLIEARNSGADYIDLLGGEVTIRKDAIELIKFAKELDFKTICLTTNGRLFSYKKILKKFLSAGLNSIIYSIHGHNEKLHDELTQSKNSFNELLAAINNTKEFGLPIHTNTTLTNDNYKHFPEIAQFLVHIGATNSEFIFLDPTYENEIEFYQNMPKISEMEAYIKKGLDIGNKNKIPHWHIRYFPLCHYEKYQNNISELNSPFENEQHSGPEFTSDNVTKGRQNIAKTKAPQCINCKLNSSCEGVWRKYIDYYGVSELIPIYNPKELKIEITKECNLDCSFCYNKDERHNQLTKEQILQTIDKYSDFKRIRITGGEPLLNPDLKEIISHAKSTNHYVLLNTNALLLSKNLTILENVDDILISMHDFSNSKYLQELIPQIRKTKQNIKLRFCTILIPENMEQIEKFYEFFNDLDIDDWFLLRPLLKQEMTIKTTNIITNKIYKLNQKYNIKTYISNSIPYCINDKIKHICDGGKNDSGFNSLLVDTNGNIRLDYSNSTILGNIDSNKKEILNNSKLLETLSFKHLSKICKSCEHLETCRGSISKSNHPDPLIPNLDLKSKLNQLKYDIQSKNIDLQSALTTFYNNTEFHFQCPLPETWTDSHFDPRNKWPTTRPNGYIHIPFCLYSCNYCTFPKTILKDEKEIDTYLKYLKKEIALYDIREFKTLYIGGGTPSILTSTQISELFNILSPLIQNSDEVTFESNPDSITEEKLKLLKKSGVTRISLGVQTFDNKRLKQINRNHTTEKIEESIRTIKKLDLKLNIDLLFGLPNQTEEHLISDLTNIIKFKPDNITYQKMHLLDGSTFKKLNKTQDIDSVNSMNISGRKFLEENNYNQMSEEDYSPHKKGFQFQKNHLQGEPIIGFGQSAMSFTGNEYYRNTFNRDEYYCAIKNKQPPVSRFKKFTKNDQISRFSCFRIKSMKIDRNEFKKKFNSDITNFYKKELNFLETNKLINITQSSITPTNIGKNYLDFISWLFMSENLTNNKNIKNVKE